MVKAKYILTLKAGEPPIEDGAIIVSNGTIERVGKSEEISKLGPFDYELGDPNSDIAIPGLINAHHHGSLHYRDGLEDLPLELWLPRRVQLYKLSMSQEESYWLALWSAMEHLKSGVTAMVDFYTEDPGPEGENWIAALTAYKDLGMRVAFCIALADQNHFVYADDEEFLKGLPAEIAERLRKGLRPFSWEEFFPRWKAIYDRFHGQDDRIEIYLAPIGVQWCSDALLKRVKQTAQEFRTGIQIHLSETKYQRYYGERRFGKSLAKHLGGLAFLGPEVSLAHGVWLDLSDIGFVARSGATVVHNPSSNWRLRSGIAPILEMISKGVNLAFGVDGMGFNDDGDILADLHLAWLMHRWPGIDAPRLSARTLLEMATSGGARVLMMEDKLGSIEPGKRADIVLIDGERLFQSPYQSPDLGLEDILLHRAVGKDVETVIIDGKIALRDGQLPGINLGKGEAILSEMFRKRCDKADKERDFIRRVEEHIRDFYRRWDEEMGIGAKPTYNLL